MAARKKSFDFSDDDKLATIEEDPQQTVETDPFPQFSPTVVSSEVPGDTVIVTVPKEIHLRLGSGVRVFKPGVQRVEKWVAEHWWMVRNGVRVFESTGGKNAS